VTDSADIDANNAGMPSVGVLFDPANDALTPGGKNANYLANIDALGNPFAADSTFYVANSNQVTSFTQSAPNKLTIESGTLALGVISDGRDGQGSIVQNGGTLISDAKFSIQSYDHSQTIGSGTFEYHGGTYIANNQVHVGDGQTTFTAAGVAGRTSAGVGKFVVYNDGPAGAILISNGLTFGLNTMAQGTIGIVEFHYDVNADGVRGTRPVQDNFNTTNGQLKLSNGTTTSSRLNLVLDDFPGTPRFGDPNASYINLGLFKDQTITGQGTFPRLFYSLATDNAYTQGATIAATYGGFTYSWTISYSGLITFDNTATSAYTWNDISATGGSDVVLLGLTPVPEPGSMALLGGASSLILARRRQKTTR
jgi:hypothetical protein